MDWPKQGNSRPWRGLADHGTCLQCTHRVLNHFDIDQVALVSLSQGGALALAYAIEVPDRVERLVAIAPAGIIDFPPILHQVMWLLARMPWLTKGISSFWEAGNELRLLLKSHYFLGLFLILKTLLMRFIRRFSVEALEHRIGKFLLLAFAK